MILLNVFCKGDILLSRQGVPTSAFCLGNALVADEMDGDGRVWGRIRACWGRDLIG